MSTMLDEALEYLARGWSVFPCQGKKPLFPWAAYQERLPTADEVRKWWTQNPNANIAMATGKVSGLVVVDVDIKPRQGKDGKMVKADPVEVFNRSPTGLVSRTGSGGGHLFFKYPDDVVDTVHNRVGADAIDIRGDGGYVILPPSSHESGKRYVWLSDKEPSDCPDFVWAEQGEKGETGHDNTWLSKLLAGGMDDGDGRNDACTRLVGYYAGKNLARDVTTILINQWNQTNKTPLPQGEITATIASVYRAAAKNKPAQQLITSKPTTFGFTPFAQYMRKHGDTAVQWIIDEWLPEKTIAFVIAPPGSYKTWGVFDLAVSVASGKPFLGQYPVLTSPGPVLIIQQEDFHGSIAERFGVVVAAKHGLAYDTKEDEDSFSFPNPPNLPIYFHEDRKLKFENQGSLDALEQKIAQIRPKLCVVDPLYSAADTDDYMAKSAQQMLCFKQWRDKYGCSFLFVHHTKKMTEGVSTREGAWGSQFLNAFLETGWQIRRMPEEGDNTVSIQRHFKVKGSLPPLMLDFDISTDFPARYVVKTEIVDEEKLEQKSNITGCVEENGPLTVSQIAEKLKVNRSSISRKVTSLIKNGVLVKNADGKVSIPSKQPVI